MITYHSYLQCTRNILLICDLLHDGNRLMKKISMFVDLIQRDRLQCIQSPAKFNRKFRSAITPRTAREIYNFNFSIYARVCRQQIIAVVSSTVPSEVCKKFATLNKF